MIEASERRFIYSLRKEECLALLTALDKDLTGAVSTLRVHLSNLAKKASESEIPIFAEHKKLFEKRKDSQIFQKYAESLPFAECHEVLVDFKGETEESEETQRAALVEALNETLGEEREGWLEIAEEFCENSPANSSTRNPEVQENVAGPSNESPNNTGSVYDSAEDEVQSQNGQDRENVPPRSGCDRQADAPRNCNKTPRSFQNKKIAPISMGSVMDQIRKWNLKFRGGAPTAALDFLEDVEDRALAYEIPLDLLPKAMLELLQGYAMQWYKGNREDWATWEDFKDSFYMFFVPSRMRVELDDEIRAFKQKPNQKINDYIIELQTLMRRVGGLTENEKLNRIYANMSYEYQLYIKRTEFDSLKQLKSLGEDYEYKIQNQKQRNHQRTVDAARGNEVIRKRETYMPRNSTISSVPIPPQDFVPPQPNPFRTNAPTENSQRNPQAHTNSNNRPTFICYNCDQEGHTSRFCKKPRRPFCVRCRKRGIRSEDCNCEQNPITPTMCTICRRQGYTTETCPCAQAGPSNVSEENSTSSHDDSALTDQRPRKFVTILGQTFRALLDSGASTSYVNKKVVNWLESQNVRSEPVYVCTYMANRAIDCTKKAYWLEIKMDQKSITSKFLVMNEMLDEVTPGKIAKNVTVFLVKKESTRRSSKRKN